jgi:hypothetical protein
LAVIVVDKDFNELTVLRDAFPQADVVLCQFHVQKYLKKIVAHPKFDISVQVRKDLHNIFQSVIYAQSSTEYLRLVLTKPLLCFTYYNGFLVQKIECKLLCEMIQIIHFGCIGKKTGNHALKCGVHICGGS